MFIASLFKSWGYDTNIEEFGVLFPTPKTARRRADRAGAVHGEARRAAGAGRCDVGADRANSFRPTTPTRSTATSPAIWSTRTTASRPTTRSSSATAST